MSRVKNEVRLAPLSLTTSWSLTRTWSGLTHHSSPRAVIKIQGWQLAVLSTSGDSVSLLWARLHQHLWMMGVNWVCAELDIGAGGGCIDHSGSCVCSTSHLGSFYFVELNVSVFTSKYLWCKQSWLVKFFFLPQYVHARHGILIRLTDFRSSALQIVFKRMPLRFSQTAGITVSCHQLLYMKSIRALRWGESSLECQHGAQNTCCQMCPSYAY